MAYNIADLFEHAVDTTPDRVAVVCGERRLTFAELDERANRLAHYFIECGIGPGAHIGVYSRNSVESLETMLAAYKIRAVSVNINYRYQPGELRYIFDDADLVALVHERRYSDRVSEAVRDLTGLRHVLVVDDGTEADATGYGGVDYESALSGRSTGRDFSERSADDLYLLYTGGTTGQPKGVMWRHEDIWRTLGGGIDFMTGEPMADEWQQSRTGAENGGLVRLPAAPFIHGAAQWAALGNLFACSAVVFVPEFDPHEIWRAVEREKVNVLFIVGDAMARPLIEAFHEHPYDVSSVLAISSSAALFSPSVKEQYLDAIPNAVITDSIGSSETGFSGISVVTKDEEFTGGPRVKADSQTCVIDDECRKLEPGTGEVGWIARRGHVPLGYYKDDEKSRKVFVRVDGVPHVVPGDHARVEADGTVTMLGRGVMCVNTGGEKVFPEEVEGALKSHPDVFDVLVFGVPDERMGERVAAVVQARPGAEPSLEELNAHVREQVAGYKVARTVWLVDEVRRSPSGKPDYQWARRYAERTEPSHTEGAAAPAADVN
ncbi:AMP-binding protein [Allosaccharopolyspora coralli]|uniref:AMP-binding protein n=1 Tax=Allosaccharopolyspora coralli TaxID=2665642 RepID=A0A5Q3Q7B1_9PSEU|nr:acyl-CoA synthetase [Allosaccharopolyspora coralli]QGK70362.1 AMP-binding protein [Allosaccharopolyspora coralli]